MSRMPGASIVVLLVLLAGTICRAEERQPAEQRSPWAPLPLLRGQDKELVWIAGEKLLHGSTIERRKAAFILGQIGTDIALAAPLADGLSDSDRQVRIQAGVAMAQRGSPYGYEGAKAALYEGDPWLQYYALFGLNQIGDKRARNLIRQNPCTGDPFLSQVAAALASAKVSAPQGPFFETPLVANDWDELLDVAVQALVDEADVWFHEGNYDQVIRFNEAAVFLDPSWVEVYAVTAWLQWSMNRHGAAVSTYRRAASANPDDWEAYFELGFYYMHHGHLRAAVKYLKKSFELGAPAISARSYAHALEKSGRLQDALLVWQQLDNIDESGVVDANIARLRTLLPDAATH